MPFWWSFCNSVMNGKIYNSNLFQNVFIPFAPDDSGNSIEQFVGKVRIKNYLKNLSPYQGSDFLDKDILKILKRNKIKYTKVTNIAQDCSSELLKHKLFAGFKVNLNLVKELR